MPACAETWKLHMQPAAVADLDAGEVEAQDLAAVRPEEASRVELCLEREPGAVEERAGSAPAETHIG